MPGSSTGHGAWTYQGCWHHSLINIWLSQCWTSHRKVKTDNWWSNFNNKQSKINQKFTWKLFIVGSGCLQQTQHSNISDLVTKDNAASLIFSIITCLFCSELIQNPKSKFIRRVFVAKLLSDSPLSLSLSLWLSSS